MEPFWDRFEVSVDANHGLTAVDKFTYLVSQLDKEPLMIEVESLPLTNENYTVAVDILKKRYGDSKMLVAQMYRKLNDMKPVSSEVSSLRRFVTEIDCLLGGLGALCQNTSDDNFATIILSKLPGNTVMVLDTSKKVDEQWAVALVREKLPEYMIRFERSADVSSGESTKWNQSVDFTADSLFAAEKKKRKPDKPPRFKHEKGASKKPEVNRMGSAPRDPAKKDPTCVFCGGGHWPEKCQKFQSASTRQNKLGNRYWICLSSKHRKNDCPSTKPCFYCKKVKAITRRYADRSFQRRGVRIATWR